MMSSHACKSKTQQHVRENGNNPSPNILNNNNTGAAIVSLKSIFVLRSPAHTKGSYTCLLYTSDAADEEDSVDLGGRRIIKKKNKTAVQGREKAIVSDVN
eukprot:TRINITY_DN15723_c0_g1_i1.p2 TRINITY_DN15723_c0_g1~~TRINITY_DN15723_c0_g1_i1.p2  ORF type:complete len:100 (-),score=6.36 TRINITY_DN15723_c0_g1_i1:15-314(-)